MTTPDTRTQVSFTGNFARPEEENPGEDLAAFLVDGLTEAGFACSSVEDIDFAYAFRVVVGNRHFYLMAGMVDDGVRQWLVSTKGELPLFRRLLGERDHEEYRVLTGVVHHLLTDEPGVGDIRWYTLTGWDEDPDNKWAPTPSWAGRD